MENVAFHTGRHGEDAYEGGYADQRHFPYRGINKQHGRIQCEHIGHDKGADGQFCGCNGSFHGIGLGNGGTGISSQSHGRRQVSHDAEVEHKEMRSHSGHAHPDEDRGAGCRHNAVVGSGGHAHAQHDAANHGQKQCHNHLVTSQGHNAVDQHIGKTGHGDGTGNDACNAAGCGNGNHTLTAGSQSFQQPLGGDAGVLVEQADKNGGDNGQGCGILNGALAGSYQIHQQHQRQQQINLLQQGTDFGQLFLAQTPQALFLGLQVHGDKDSGKVQHSGQDGLDHDLAIGNLDIVRHQECGGAHNGGHDLTAGGGGGFRRSGKFRLIASALHQRDGYGAGANGIGNGGTGNHAFHGAGHHGYLGRAAGEAAHHSIGNVDEEIRNAGTLQESAEDDEHHNELRAHIDGSGEDAFLAVEQVADGIVQFAPQRGIGKSPAQGINQEGAGHNQNGQAHTAAADFRQSQNTHNADDNLIPGKVGALLDDVDGIGGKVQERAGSQHHTHNVIPGHGIGLYMALSGGEHQKAQQHNPSHEGRQPQLFQPAGKQGDVDAEQGERSQNAVDSQPGLAFPDSDVGLLVILLHHRFQIHGFFRFCLFLEKCHTLPPWICGKRLRRMLAAARFPGFNGYSVSTVTPFSAKYLAAPAWKGAVIPLVAFSTDSSAPLPFSAAMASVLSKIALVRL